MLTFTCPFCKERKLKSLDYIVCPGCYGQMRSALISNIEHRTSIDKEKDLYTGALPSKDPAGLIVKAIAPVGASSQIYTDEVRAVFPTSGMAKRSPLLICCGEDDFPQPHPQMDKPFTRYFVKGLLYSSLGNVIPFALMKPPVWIFWLSTFAFAGVYYYYSRKIPATGNAAKKAILAQNKLFLEEKTHD